MTVPVLGPDATPDAIGSTLDEVGCCIIADAVSTATTNAIRTELKPYAEQASIAASEFEGLRTRRTGGVVLRSPTFRSIARHPAVLAAGDHVLGSFTSWGLSSSELIEIMPGQTPQPLHRDQWKYDYVDLPCDVDVEAMWAITDFTEENGATHVIPGSHRWANDLRPDIEAAEPAEMAAGSLLLYLGSTYHGGGANRSGASRVGLSLQHAAGWLRQGEMLLLECPPSVVADWDDELVRFIGYRRGGDSLGVYLDSLDPMAAVHPDREFARGWGADVDMG